MTTDELNAIVQAVMTELEKAGVDFDFKAETPQADDLVYVMRGTADKYMGITVKWQNLLDLIVKKATDAKNEAVSAKDIAIQTLATIQGIESNVSTMKSSVETTKGEVEALKSDVSAMKASVETSEVNVTQMKSDVSEMKTSVEGTKSDVTNLKTQTQTIVDNAKDEVTGLLDTKVNKTDSLTYEEIMATNPVPDLTNKVASADALKTFNTNISEQIGIINYIPQITSSMLGSSFTEDYFQKWCNYVFTNYKDKLDRPIISFVSPNSNGVVIGNIYNLSGDKILYAGLIYIHYAEGLYYFGYDNGTWYWRNIK